MVTKKNPRFDFAAWQQNVQKQFSNLDPKDPSVWPLVPRLGLYVLIIAFVVGGLWYALLSDFKTELETEQAKELTLRQDYQFKLGKAVNLEELKKQREQKVLDARHEVTQRTKDLDKAMKKGDADKINKRKDKLAESKKELQQALDELEK